MKHCKLMKNLNVIELENKLHGYHTRLKELHFNAPSISLHKIIDEFDSDLQEFDDNIMEDAQSIFGFIEPGELSPILPEAIEIEALLVEIKTTLIEFYQDFGDAVMWIGVKSEFENFIHGLCKTIYLVKIAKKELS